MDCQSGYNLEDNDKSFSDFCEYTYNDLTMYVLKLTAGNKYLAEDIVQNTYCIAKINQSRLCQSYNPAGWLYSTAKHVFYKEITAIGKINNIETLLTEDIADDHDDFLQINGEIDTITKADIFIKVFEKMPEKDKKLITDHYMNNLSLKEIAFDSNGNYENIRKKHYRLIKSIIKKVDEETDK